MAAGETYEEFVAKFEPRRTTDDCLTPPEVYEAVKVWACGEYGIDPRRIVRPFYPGGDYEAFDYSGGAVVVDNPPFSMLTRICEFYLERGVPFFMFAPALTIMSRSRTCTRMCRILCNAQIVYENGASVNTGFVTSFGGDVVARTAPDLYALIADAVANATGKAQVAMAKYEYPDNVITAAVMNKWAKYGIEFEVRRDDCAFVSRLDEQAAHGKGIFGGGLLLSDAKAADRAAADRAAADRAAAIKWNLSDRERAVVASLGRR